MAMADASLNTQRFDGVMGLSYLQSMRIANRQISANRMVRPLSGPHG
jgi:hypothetical protein